MNDRVKCSRCALELEGELVIAELCLACLVVVSHDGAVLLSVDADLRSRGIPHDARASICRAIIRQGLAGTPTCDLPAIADLVQRAQLEARGPMIGASSSARLEAWCAIGAGAWERWVAEGDHTPGRIERLLALRPYRRQVVRLILEGIAEGTGAKLWS